MEYTQPIGADPGDPYVDANPVAGIEGSAVPAAAIEHPQREIVNAITAAGLEPDSGDLTQLTAAIQAMIDAATASLGSPVGTVVSTIRTTAPTGWLLLNGDSIGSAASGADQGSDAYEALFKAFWESMADSEAPVSGGRGASAQADWDADKTLTLPDARGRTTIGSGTGSGLTARTHGDTGGEEAHTLTEAEMPSHGHPFRFITASASWALSTGGALIGTTSVSRTNRSAYSGVPSDSAGQQIGGTGGDAAHNNMQPWLALNKIVRY